MSATCARAAAGAIYAVATFDIPYGARREPMLARLQNMQADMDRIAVGKLPIRPNGRNATASDVEAYLAGQRQTVRAA